MMVLGTHDEGRGIVTSARRWSWARGWAVRAIAKVSILAVSLGCIGLLAALGVWPLGGSSPPGQVLPRGSLTTAASPVASPGPAYEAWVVGGNGMILATADNGVHWRQQASGSAAFLESVAFRDPLHGWVLTTDDRILRSKSGGLKWHVQWVAHVTLAGIDCLPGH